MNASEVLRRAALACELVEATEGARTFSCVEIDTVLREHPCDTDVRRFYRELYAPDSPGGNRESCWAHHYLDDVDGYGPLGWNDDVGPRVIALCLAAAIAEDSGVCSNEAPAK